jgi:hypothetical protein
MLQLTNAGATGTRTLSSNSNKNAKAIDQEVAKMFEKFPPQQKKR